MCCVWRDAFTQLRRLAEAVHSEGVFLGVSQCGVVRRLCVWRAGSVITSCYRNLVGRYLASVIEWRSGECAFWYKGRGVREVRAAVLWAGLVWMNMPELTCSEWWDAGLQLGEVCQNAFRVNAVGECDLCLVALCALGEKFS